MVFDLIYSILKFIISFFRIIAFVVKIITFLYRYRNFKIQNYFYNYIFKKYFAYQGFLVQIKKTKDCNILYIANSANTPVFSVFNNSIFNQKVEKIGFNEEFGNFVVIRNYLFLLPIFWTNYFHLNSISIHKNEQIEKDKVIGYIGATGNIAGNCLGFTITLKNIF